MADYRIISSDNHVIEPPDLWTTTIGSHFGDQVPKIMETEYGQCWVAENKKLFGIFQMGSQTGRRFEYPEKLQLADTWKRVRPGAYIGEEAVKDLDVDGVDVALIYPSLAIFLYPFVENSKMLTAIFRVYNDFVADYCRADPRRLKPIAVINIDDVQQGLEELRRCVGLGFVGAAIPEYVADKGYDSPEYDRLWAAAQDLDMPLGFHIFTPRVKAGRGWDRSLEDTHMTDNLFLTNCDFWVRVSLCEIILTGVFERFPRLRIGVAEHELNWVPYFLERMDFNYNERPTGRQGYRLKNGALPSDHFHSNVFVDFQQDVLGIRHRDIIGVDNILWGSDYPHEESTWPRSRQFIEDTLIECSEEEKVKIVGGNAARIYGI